MNSEQTQAVKKDKKGIISLILGIISWCSFLFMIPVAIMSKDAIWIIGIIFYGLPVIGLILSLLYKQKGALKTASFIINGVPVAIAIVVIIMTLFHAL